MGKRNRKRRFNLSLIAFSILLLLGCTNHSEKVGPTKEKAPVSGSISYYGNTQGTTYAILCSDSIILNQEEITQTLHDFDMMLSTYIPESVLSRLNASGKGRFEYQDSMNYMNDCLMISKKVYDLTNGAFDPTVFPLLEAWGFLKDTDVIPDSAKIRSILAYTGFNENQHFSFTTGDTAVNSIIYKRTASAKLVFNAIAQGQAVDVIAKLLESKGAKNYFVEIGGEIKVKGRNSEGKLWSIGIDKPIEHSNAGNREIMEIIQLNNKSVATSGSYRQFYEKDGQKYSHTIDPKTGYPVQHQLLSVSVVADNCALADGLATAFMVMGTDRVIEYVKAHPDLNVDVYLIFNNSKNRLETYMTNGFKNLILE